MCTLAPGRKDGLKGPPCPLGAAGVNVIGSVRAPSGHRRGDLGFDQISDLRTVVVLAARHAQAQEITLAIRQAVLVWKPPRLRLSSASF